MTPIIRTSRIISTSRRNRFKHDDLKRIDNSPIIEITNVEMENWSTISESYKRQNNEGKIKNIRENNFSTARKRRNHYSMQNQELIKKRRRKTQKEAQKDHNLQSAGARKEGMTND